MKVKKLKLQKISIKSFTTNLKTAEVLTIKGGDTEDNTDVRDSLYWCDGQSKPHNCSIQKGVCIRYLL